MTEPEPGMLTLYEVMLHLSSQRYWFPPYIGVPSEGNHFDLIFLRQQRSDLIKVIVVFKLMEKMYQPLHFLKQIQPDNKV
jgi:hypothetical protein